MYVIAPPDHHRASALGGGRSVIGAAYLVFIDVRKCDFYQFRTPALFVQDGTGHGAHSMIHEAPLETHPLQRHVY